MITLRTKRGGDEVMSLFPWRVRARGADANHASHTMSSMCKVLFMITTVKTVTGLGHRGGWVHGLFGLEGQGGLSEETTFGQSRQWYVHDFKQQARALQMARAESCGGSWCLAHSRCSRVHWMGSLASEVRIGRDRPVNSN